MEKRLEIIRARHGKFEQKSEKEEEEEKEEEKEGNDSSAAAEKLYMIEVIQQIVSNGTASNCSLRNDDSISRDHMIEKVANSIYDLSGTFYYVS